MIKSMFSLVIAVILGLIFAFFAGQNTGGVSLNLFSYQFLNVPLYLVVLGSLLLGVVISYLINLVEGVGSAMTLRGKDHTIHQTQAAVTKLQERIKELELDNARLRGDRIDFTGSSRRLAFEERPKSDWLAKLKQSFSW